jgi:tetratricopeptide (TPR) repeat protein
VNLAFILTLAVFAAALAVYLATAARSLTWGGTAELATIARTLGVARPPGHPLYTLVSAFVVRVPLGAPVFRLSALSALLAAGAVAALTRLTWELTGVAFRPSPSPASAVGRAAGSVLAGATLALSPTFWTHATDAGIHPMTALTGLSGLAFLIAWVGAGTWRGAAGGGTSEAAEGESGPASQEAGAGGDRALYAAWFLLGLSLAHVPTAVFLVPTFVILTWGGLRRRPGFLAVAGSLTLFAVGLSAYVYLLLRSQQGPGVASAELTGWSDVLRYVASSSAVTPERIAPFLEVAREAVAAAVRLPSEIHWTVLAAAAAGLWVLWKRSPLLLVALALPGVLAAAHAVGFFLRASGDYLVPAYTVLAIGAGVGLTAVVAKAHWRSGVIRVAVLAVPVAVLAVVMTNRIESLWPAHDRRAEDAPSVYLGRLLDGLPGDSIVYTEADHLVSLLRYARSVEGVRHDVSVVDVRDRARRVDALSTGVALPVESELAAFFGQESAVPCEPLARDVLPVRDYLPLVLSKNAGERPQFADVRLGAASFPDRCVRAGLLVEVAPSRIVTVPSATPLTADAPWSGYLRDLTDGGSTSQATLETYAGTLAEYGRLALAKSAVEEAIPVLEAARDLAPWLPEARNALGVAFLRAGRVQEAFVELEHALELAPGLAETRYHLHEWYLGGGDLERARDELTAAVRLDRWNAGYRLDLAALLERMDELERADSVYRCAERVLPYEWSVKFAYGDFLARHRRYPEAVSAYRRAEELGPVSAVSLRNIGRCYWEVDDAERAISALRRSVELQPFNPGLKYDLAVMLRASGRPHEALDLLEEAIRILPGIWRARVLKASILGDLGRYAEARRVFESAETLGADGPGFWGAWVEMERAAGDSVRADEIGARMN